LLFLLLLRKKKNKNPFRFRNREALLLVGTVIANPGTFDPTNPTPAGQTLHGDHAYVFYQIPVEARKYPLVMWHGIGQFPKLGKLLPTAGKDIKTYSCAGVLGYIL